jgi:hypothetical protein
LSLSAHVKIAAARGHSAYRQKSSLPSRYLFPDWDRAAVFVQLLWNLCAWDNVQFARATSMSDILGNCIAKLTQRDGSGCRRGSSLGNFGHGDPSEGRLNDELPHIDEFSRIAGTCTDLALRWRQCLEVRHLRTLVFREVENIAHGTDAPALKHGEWTTYRTRRPNVPSRVEN